MQLTATHHYAHDAGTVFAALTDPEVLRAKYEDNGDSDVEVEATEDGGAVTVRTRRIVPLDVPGFAKKILSPRNTVVQTDRWGAPDARGGRRGTVTVEAKGVPVKVSGTLCLEPQDEGSTNTVVMKVECGIPLVGGKVAELVGTSARKTLDHDESFTRQHLGAGS